MEGAAAFLFDVFKAVEIVGSKEAVKLRNIFGPYPASAATKACNIVAKITLTLPDESTLLLSNQDRQEAEGAEYSNEFGHSIKFSSPETEEDSYLSSSDSEAEDGHKIDLQYTESKQNEAAKTALVKPPKER